MKRILFILIIGILIGNLLIISSFEASSSNYITDVVLSSGGESVSSTNYKTNVVLEVAIGSTSSSSYNQFLGFLYKLITTGTVPPATPSPGGGGSGASPSKISVNPAQINLDLIVNTNKEEIVTVKNLGTSIKDINVAQTGLDKMIIFGETSFNLAPGESKNLSIIFVASNKTGIFTGKILVGNTQISVALNVRTKLLLFDSNIIVLNEGYKVEQGRKLNTRITLIPMGDEDRLDVTLNYIVKDYNDKIYLTQSETILVEREINFKKNFDTGALPLGEYIVGLELIYPNGVATSSAHFEIIKKEFFIKIPDINIPDIIFYSISPLFIMVILIEIIEKAINSIVALLVL